MKKICLFLTLTVFFASSLRAQHIDLETQKKIWRQMVADTVTPPSQETVMADNINRKPKDSLLSPPASICNFSAGMHLGLNVNAGASAFATFGHGIPHHGGFSQNVNLNYIAPLTSDNKLWMNIGGYMNHTNWGSDNYYTAGLYGMLGYTINNHWETYVYGQLNLSNNDNQHWNYTPGYYNYVPGYYGLIPGACAFSSIWGYGTGTTGANVIGGGVRYHNKSFSLAVNIEAEWQNRDTPEYFDRYNYPEPGF